MAARGYRHLITETDPETGEGDSYGVFPARFSQRSALYPRFYFDGLHPNALLLGVEQGVGIGEPLAAQFGLPTPPTGPPPADPLAGGFAFPVYPEIGRRLGGEGELVFRNAGCDAAVGLEQMLSESFAAYGFAPAAIAALPRIAAAAETLRRQGV